MCSPRVRPRTSRRRGLSRRRLLIALAVVVGVAAVGWLFWPGRGRNSADSGAVMLHTVERGEFMHEITDRGNVESADNTEIKCEVKSKNLSGTQILWVVPEGTEVRGPCPEKPEGDLLVELDSSSLENDMIKQEIDWRKTEADYSMAKAGFSTATIALEEYQKAAFDQQVRAIESEIFVAQENKGRATDYLRYSKQLYGKGYVTAVQFSADSFAVKKADRDLAIAQNKLDLYRLYTSKKALKQLECDIDTAEAKLKAAEAAKNLSEKLLNDINDQIHKCKIYAVHDGQVVYANVTGFRGNKEVLVAAGEMARERQVLIRLPNPEKMQVAARISESKIAMVSRGMSVKIHLDAFPDVELQGQVQKVDEFPAPTGWFGSVVKEYETTVKIEQSPEGVKLKPGLTAEVRILIEHLSDVVQVPVQSVFEHGNRYYCVTGEPGGWQAREVQIGSTNDKFVVVREGLEASEQIVLNAAAYRDRAAGLPDPAESARSARAVAQRNNHTKPPAQPNGGTPQAAPTADNDLARRLVTQFDKNHDGRLSPDDLPDQWKSRLRDADTDGDGQLDLAEIRAALSRPQRRTAPALPATAASQ